jgi:hypothetical protein
MFAFFTLCFLLLNSSKSEKIELDNFKLESNNLYSLAKFTYNNYSKNSPIKQGFDFNLITNKTLSHKFQNENITLLIYFYFILSEPSLSIKSNERLCRFGLTGKDDTPDERISFLKRYLIYNNSLIQNNNISATIGKDENETINEQYLETGIKEEFLFNEIGVKEFYLYYCFLSEEGNEEKTKKINSILYLNGEINIFNTGTFESAENFYRTYLYVLITCYYACFTLYWIIKTLGNLSKLNISMAIFSITIPFVLLENIMKLEFYNQLSSTGRYNYTFKIMEVIFRFIKELGFRIIYFFIANGFQTLNKFPNKKDTQEFLVLILIYLISFTAYEASLIKYESDFIVHPLVFLIITTAIIIGVNFYIWFIYMYRRIKIYEKNFRDKNFKKNAKILNQYSFSLFACFIAFMIYVIIFSITVILANSFAKVYFKWVGDLADMSISIFFFTTICLNLWEEKQLQNFVYELNESNSNRGQGNQNTDVFKKDTKDKDNKNKYNLPNNEEVKVKNSYQSKI